MTPKQRAKRTRRKPSLRRPDAATAGFAGRTYDALRESYPDAKCALHYRNAFELLVATILSAQCTDARINMLTPALFAAYPTPAAMAAAPTEAIETLIHSAGFFRSKAKSLLGASKRLIEVYGGEVPSGMEDLLTLPGVARKTANVVRGTIWGLAEGVVVDTHVQRLAGRLGWSRGKNPVEIERELMVLFPKEIWIDLAHVLTHHGRRICSARKPRCADCPVHASCPSSVA